MLRFCYLILLNLGPITVEPAVLCDGNDCAGEGLILPGCEPGLAVAVLGGCSRSLALVCPRVPRGTPRS